MTADRHRRRAHWWIVLGIVWALGNWWLLTRWPAYDLVRFLTGSCWWPWSMAAWHYGWITRDREAIE